MFCYSKQPKPHLALCILMTVMELGMCKNPPMTQLMIQLLLCCNKNCTVSHNLKILFWFIKQYKLIGQGYLNTSFMYKCFGIFYLTPSPRVTRFHVARNSTSAEFLKTALCGIPLQWNSSKSCYAEFQRNSKYSPTNAIFA